MQLPAKKCGNRTLAACANTKFGFKEAAIHEAIKLADFAIDSSVTETPKRPARSVASI